MQGVGGIQFSRICLQSWNIDRWDNNPDNQLVSLHHDFPSSIFLPNLHSTKEAKEIDYVVVKEDLRAYGQKSEAFLKKVTWN